MGEESCTILRTYFAMVQQGIRGALPCACVTVLPCKAVLRCMAAFTALRTYFAMPKDHIFQ